MFNRLVYAFVLFISFGFLIWFLFFNYIFYLSNTDDIIYSQALQLITWNELNPFIPIRQVHIFNDHFDLILIPIALTIAKIFPPLAVGYFLEIFFIFLSIMVLYYMYRKKDISFSVLVLSTMIFLLSESLFMSVTLPFHPTTWSVFPLTLIGYFLFKNNERAVIYSYLFLLLFKEIYVLVGGALVLFYLYKKKYSVSIISFVITLFWSLLVFKIRYLIWDYKSINYVGFITQFSFDGIKNMFINLVLGHKVLIHHVFAFFPILVLFIFAFVKKIRLNITPFVLLFPLWLLNFSMASPHFWNNHRIVFYSPLLAMFVVFTFKKKTIPKSILLGLLIFFMFVHMEYFIRYIPLNQWGIREISNWDDRWERRKKLDDMVRIVSSYKEENIFASFNLIGHLTNNNRVFGYNNLFGKDGLKVDKRYGIYYLFDKIKKKDVNKYYIKDKVENVIIDNEYVLFVKMKDGYKPL